jgi:hypothetical protein
LSHPQLVSYFKDIFLAGYGFSTIVEARQVAADILGMPVRSGTAITKVVDESIEAGIIRASRIIIQRSATTHEAYNHLVDLLNRQPNLTVRSSTSILQQAYSTPVPIAYLASVLAGIDSTTTVYEPTAGNGALLIGANSALVTANELNGDRFQELTRQGYGKLTQQDALAYHPESRVDQVICNPPFGTIQGKVKRPKRFRMADTWTTQIDQIIALNALKVMKDDGRAALILGGKKGSDIEGRSDRYNTRESRAFYYVLYRNYNVTQHISIWGDLYRKQGAGFPIDVLVIQGRGSSQRHLPAANVPPIYTSFSELKELIPNESLRHLSQPVVNRVSRTPVRRESPSIHPATRSSHLSVTHGRTPGLDDWPMAGGEQLLIFRDPETPGLHPGHPPPLPRPPTALSAGRRGDDPPNLAAELGRDLYPLQRPLHSDTGPP